MGIREKTMNQEEGKFFKCSCEGHGILVRRESYANFGGEAREPIIIEFYDRHPGSSFPLLHRLQRAWWQLRGSHRLDPQDDECLHPQEAKRLGEYLIELAESGS